MEHVERVWEFPPQGWVKINVHSEFIQNVQEGQARNGIGVIARDSTGHLLRLTYGTIPGLTNLNSALWSILIGMRRAFQDQYYRVIIETDNIQAYRECRYYGEEGITPHTRNTFRFILSRLKDHNFEYDIKLVHPQRNGVARRLATIGRQNLHDLQTFDVPVDNVQELINIDLGLGPAQARFQDIEINDPEPAADGQVVNF